MSLNERLALCPELRDTAQWGRPDEGLLAPEEKLTYQRRKRAIELYMDGTSLRTIELETALAKSEVYRYTKRCLEIRPTGELFGFFGVLPRLVQKPYTRQSPLRNGPGDSPSGLAGAFMQLVATNKELHAYLTSSATRMRLKSARQITKAIFKGFLQRCEKVRGEHEYPFNTKSKGRRALERFIASFLEIYWLSRKQEEEWIVRTGQPRSVSLLRPYEEVENDGHLGDMFFVFKERNLNGGWLYSTPMKCFLVLNVDRASRGIFGYSYNLGSTNYPDVTVCRSVVSSLTPWQPKQLTVPGLAYKPGAGLPYGGIEGMPPCLIDAFYLDNGRSNRARLVFCALATYEGAVVNHGRAGEPTARAFIERVNKTLEECGFRKLPVGFDPNASPESRSKALKDCERYAVTIDEFEQILDVVAANYNASEHSSLLGQMPNEFLREWLRSKGTLIREAIDPRALVRAMFRMEFIKTIRGGKTQARPPYVQIWGARYSNEALRKLKDWVGLTVRLVFDIDEDIRLCRCFLRRGRSEIDIGVLNAQPPWHLTPHTLRQRLQARKALKTEKVLIPSGADALQVLWRKWAREAEDDRGAAKKLVRMEGHLPAAQPSTARDARKVDPKRWVSIRLK